MKKLTLFILAASFFISCSNKNSRIICIGDSITEGAGIEQQNKYSYPAILDSLLGKKFAVLNSGKSGTTMQKSGDFSYWKTKEFSNIFAYNPNVVIIKLGTNDTKPHNWNSEDFEADYQALIDTIRSISTQPKIFLCIPVPVFETRWGINDSTLVSGVIPIIKKLALKNKLELINLNESMKNNKELFPDHIHPNEKGTNEMAKIIARIVENTQNNK